MIVQLSAGQGPIECQLAVEKLFNAFKKEFVDIEMLYGKESEYGYYSLLFSTQQDLSHLVGTILWICKSPIRTNHKRKNWFVDVSIIPEVEEINVDENYKIEKFHCGGKGGQNVNKVETGVRVIHIPTGITTTSTEERSQYLNKQKALKKIQTILTTIEKQNKAKQLNQSWEKHNQLIRGNPIRTYVGLDFSLRK